MIHPAKLIFPGRRSNQFPQFAAKPAAMRLGQMPASNW
jgi:hypothetical protein